MGGGGENRHLAVEQPSSHLRRETEAKGVVNAGSVNVVEESCSKRG